MRIDKAERFKLSIGIIQNEVNRALKYGRTLEQIQEAASVTPLTIGRGELEPINCTVKVIVEPSHLGKGLIAFYKCPKCQRERVRSLYLIGLELGCRTCLHLTYKKQDRRQVTINRLIWDDELREKYYNSWSTSRIRKAMKADDAREIIREQGQKLGEEIIKHYKNSVSK